MGAEGLWEGAEGPGRWGSGPLGGEGQRGPREEGREGGQYAPGRNGMGPDGRRRGEAGPREEERGGAEGLWKEGR